MSTRPVYLDYAAATPTDPRVIEEMVKCLSIDGTFANPHAKDHVYGWQAAEVVEQNRERVAALIGVSPLEITFTSGATESNNLALLGLYQALKARGDPRCHIVTDRIEHKSVLECCEALEKEGCRVTYLTPRKDGSIDTQLLAEALEPDTFLVSIAQANSVLGTVSDVHALAALCKSKGIFFHTDTAQSAGYVQTDFEHSDVTMATLTSEKICGPKGVGALYVKRSAAVPLAPLISGGGQERGLRGGTVPTHQIAGMGKAFEIMQQEGRQDAERIAALRLKLEQGLRELPGIIFNGSAASRVPGILSVSFEGVDGHMLLPSLPGIAASTGSACASDDLKPSYVLKAIGHSDSLARASLRLSLGRWTTQEEIERALLEIQTVIPRLQQAGSMWNVKQGT
ncbi:MAG: aminotransferase class V-fold PLP-dependent enzyme [Succinivibrio sp.]|nr:aminotransferase class V-fold PLP-dependent enzyme [Succinivibrio sp.]